MASSNNILAQDELYWFYETGETVTGDIMEQIKDWGDVLYDMLPNVAAAFLVLFVFFLLGRLVRSWVKTAGNRISDNKVVSNLLALISYIGMLLIGILIALKIVNLDGAATSILAGAGIVGLALGFAFQDIAANFISGVVLALQRPVKIGDLVETQEIFGIIKNINLRSTEIETLQGQLVHIPNKEVLLNPMIDYVNKRNRRVDLEIGVSYSDDLQRAKDVVIEALKNMKVVNQKMPIDFYYTDFGDSSINFTVRFWTPFRKQTDFLQARSDAIIAIKNAFDEQGISIPFPVSTFEFNPEQVDLILNKK